MPNIVERDLLPTQKNQVLQAIESASLNPVDFQLFTAPSTRCRYLYVARLAHRRSAFFFTFDYADSGGEQRYSEWSPGDTTITSWATLQTWPEQLSYFTRWLVWLKRELNAPDYWALGSSGSLISRRPALGENTPFSEAEKVRIVESLEEIHRELASMSTFNQQEALFVDDSFAYLKAAAERTGRIDWRNILVAQLMNVATMLALQPDNLARLAQVLSSAFGWLTGHPLLPPS